MKENKNGSSIIGWIISRLFLTLFMIVAVMGFTIPSAHALNLETSAQDKTADPGAMPNRPAAKPGSPNVLVWLMDDVGFAQVSRYGGLVETPNIDRVAAQGLSYSNFRSTPICSASRVSLLTGRNPHTVHIGGHAQGPRGYPGYDTLVPPEHGTVAENFRQGGYKTYALGKWDHAPITDMTQAGPYTYWPMGQGFDRFYGFLTADTDNWDPTLWDGNAPVAKPEQSAYHLNRDLADKAIELIGSRNAAAIVAPFFMYWATGTAHAPHHAPADWIAKYKGKFDEGWDVAREKVLAKQIKLGIIPANTELPPRPDEMPAWANLNADQKRLFTRQMEVFAASLSYADHQFGRILDALEARGELDNTIVVITSDNGADAGGGPGGLMNEICLPNSHMPSVAENLKWLEKWGGPETYPIYHFGWAVAGNTPFNYYKQTAYEGGIHVPLVIAWPKGIPSRGEWREQFAYIADIAPTVLDAAGVKPAKITNGVAQSEFDGQNLTDTFSKSEETHGRAQYFEFYGNRSLWFDGWKVVANSRVKTWDLTSTAAVDNAWALYNLEQDPGEIHNLAEKHPEKLTELSAAFAEQAKRFNVDPLDGGGGTRVYMKNLLKAEFGQRRGRWSYPQPVSRTGEFTAPPVKWLSYTFSADINLANGKETGSIFALGSSLGGLGLYLKDGKPVFMMRGLMGEEVKLAASSRLSKGDNKLVMRFENLNPRQRMPMAVKDFHVTIGANGQKLLSEKAQFAMPGTFSSTETFDIGIDDGKALTDDYPSATPFPGSIRNIIFDFTPIAGKQ